MAHAIRILKAMSLKKVVTRYEREKEMRYKEDSNLVQKQTLWVELEHKYEKSCLGKFMKKVKTPDTLENVACKSFLGFVGGVILTYIFFFFFYIGVNFSLRTTTYICGIAGMILCLGLAFSSRVRCYVFLLLPVFFSKQGRQALLAYALFLAFTGPAKNSMHNMGILSDSMTCSQETVKRTLKQIIEMVKAPFKSIKETIENITKSIKEVVKSVKEFVIKIKRIIVSVLKVIKKASTWLGSIVNFCNKKVGTPFQRCMKTFDDAIEDCKAKIGVMAFMCHVVHVVKGLCYSFKWLDFICSFTEIFPDQVVGVVRKKLKEFDLHMKNLFYVSIELSHNYEFETSSSNSTKYIAKTIIQKISSKVEKLQNIISLCGFMFSFLFLFVFFKVYYYKYKYLSSDRYDNLYINKYIIELDIKRAQMNRETVLPLEPREKKKYAKASSLRLLQDEKSRVAESMFLLSLASFKIISFLVCDYSLYWVLITIYEAAHDSSDKVERGKVTLNVDGNGILADFYRNLGNTFQPPDNPEVRVAFSGCLPDPVPPDTGRYLQIGFLLFLCWFLTALEPYGLRLRNVVMSHYYPDRARERAVWLYNHILRSRGSFVRFARRQLRRKFQGADSSPVVKVTLAQRLFASFPLLGALFGKNKENICLLCTQLENKQELLKRCKTPDCPGRFCLKCFSKLENVCTICQHPIEYGDISDISEEIRDSSEEEYYRKKSKEYSKFDEQDEIYEGKFLTFKEMELRDRFRDIESNKKFDYAKLSDLYSGNSALRKKVKEAVKTRIFTLKLEKLQHLKMKKTVYKKLKSKIQELIGKIKKKKKWENIIKKHEIKKNFIAKLRKLKKNKPKIGDSDELMVLLPDQRDLSSKDSSPSESENKYFFDEENESLLNDISRKKMKNRQTQITPRELTPDKSSNQSTSTIKEPSSNRSNEWSITTQTGLLLWVPQLPGSKGLIRKKENTQSLRESSISISLRSELLEENDSQQSEKMEKTKKSTECDNQLDVD